MDKALRLMLAAPKSGEGKTTVTIALLAALKKRGLSPFCFKSGPDYIDPMFHQRAMGIPGGNLDLFLSGEDTVRGLLGGVPEGTGVTVIEGAMGYYDGVGMSDRASCFHLARATGTPAALIVSAKGAALSLAAAVKGLIEFKTGSNIRGVILNRCPQRLFERLGPVIEFEAGTRAFGFLPEIEEAALQSRHLGLVAAGEVAGLERRISLLGEAAERHIDIAGLLELAGEAAPIKPSRPPGSRGGGPVIAVARDEAFCFYYEETLELFRRLGAEIAEFSPVRDSAIPERASAVYLGGGYPELHAPALSKNTGMLQSIRAAIGRGMPCIAECGGFLYLHERLFDPEGEPFPMAGVIAGEAKRGGGLSRFGYVTLSPKGESMLCGAGRTLKAHEFHHWQSDNDGDGFFASKEDGRGWHCVHTGKNLYAGFPHLYLAGDGEAAGRFVAAAAKYGEKHGLK